MDDEQLVSWWIVDLLYRDYAGDLPMPDMVVRAKTAHEAVAQARGLAASNDPDPYEPEGDSYDAMAVFGPFQEEPQRTDWKDLRSAKKGGEL